MTARSLILVGLVAVSACSSKTLEIESDTQWSGAVGGNATHSVDGSGNGSISIDASGIVCWNFQKQTTAGRLRVYAKTKTIVSSERDGDAVTTAQYGVVSGCTGS